MTDLSFSSLAARAANRFQPGGRFAVGFAKGKLTGDPVFEYFLRDGVLSESSNILDLGCGQGILSALLAESAKAQAENQWPADWPPVLPDNIHGIELMPSDVRRAQAALGQHARGEGASFEVGNIATTAFSACDTVVILDVLHYLPYDAQIDVLERVYAALQPTGQLLLRIGDKDGGFGFRWSNWVDHVVTWCRGHRLPRLYCRPLDEWVDLLQTLGFQIEVKPMSQGTMFANVLLRARLSGAGKVSHE